MFEFVALLVFFGGLVVCPVLAVVYGLKALSALAAVVALGRLAAEEDGLYQAEAGASAIVTVAVFSVAEEDGLHQAEAGGHVAPAQTQARYGRLGARVVQPRQGARPGLHPPLDRTRRATDELQ